MARMSSEIEALIRPLVDAINGTGAFNTFSSCEGHFDEPYAANACALRSSASVCFTIKEGVTESSVEEFFRHILTARVGTTGTSESSLTISKVYAPRYAGAPELRHFYAFEIRPLNADSERENRRRTVDEAIREISQRVRDYWIIK